MSDFVENAAEGPDINRRTVFFLSEQNLRSSIPQSDDLVGVFLDRNVESAGKSKIGQLHKLLFSVD